MRRQNRETIKAKFREEGISIKEWSQANGFAYPTVLDVIRGNSKCSRGKGHKIAVALGLKQQRSELSRASG